ncbi:apolipoprotein D-like [Harmonia axyridis]|uniref:apolipoprotein D-like n=1 Tax=Harmonia axyridis TaxID=115357 RepID=UPI001E277B96|nr:apolipoprotein D-like [Harmonia axyridis]
MFKALLFSIACLAFLATTNGHSYHLGSCPYVEPQRSFNMQKMMGIWYAIEKTGTASSCVVYNFSKTDEPYEYDLVQTSQHFILKYTPIEHVYKYTGRLTVPDPVTPAKMSVKFPLNVAGSSNFTIISTDYDSYALIFTCQKLAFANRQSATILSRDKVLDKDLLIKLRDILSENEIDPHDLSIISQANCPKLNNESHVIDIDDETLSAKTAGNVIRGTGNAIASGAEFAVEGVGTIINKVRSDKKPEK